MIRKWHCKTSFYFVFPFIFLVGIFLRGCSFGTELEKRERETGRDRERRSLEGLRLALIDLSIRGNDIFLSPKRPNVTSCPHACMPIIHT